MKSFTVVTACAALLASVHAQQQYTIDPNSVSNSTKEQWCLSQTSECPLICLQTSPSDPNPESNTCDPTTLTYACVCGNGLSPNVSEYTQTLPYFICQEWGTQCVSNCGNDNTCASNCRSQHPCGAQHPIRANSSTISATKTPTGTTSLPAGATTNSAGQTIYSGFGGAAASTSGSSAGSAVHVQAAALNAGQTFGVLGLIGALFGGFAFLL
ncbi:hypothetical protein M433DRAFT_139032 [Acidomyces richmondensis BFW]|nr:MAG: hypothetical protein FE78DRAFT_156584 [Acidomyces sp. 'richmondensis']KYG50488.1 hypothetical protein M433DRAFT_139032 [Acidomyces richmondensis BFW]